MSLSKMQIINSGVAGSTLEHQGSIRPITGILKKALASNLTLTSLVDCFTILVVYLLMATSFGSEEINVSKDMLLPKASHSEALEKGIVVKVVNGQYELDDQKIGIEQLAEALLKKKGQADSVIIQADKRTDYSKLNPVVLTGLQAGFSKIKFAVLQEDEG